MQYLISSKSLHFLPIKETLKNMDIRMFLLTLIGLLARAVVAVLLLGGCASSPKLNPQKIRSWNSSLGSEYPGRRPVIAHYQKNEFELFYLAARHTNNLTDDTLKLVQKLFKDKQFNVLIIEPYPFSFGESPKWFLEEAQKGKTEDFIKGGESALAALLAEEKKIPFFAGEPDDKDILQGLKDKGFTELDLIGFYTVRQIPQWVREKEDKKGILERKVPNFASHYCRCS